MVGPRGGKRGWAIVDRCDNRCHGEISFVSEGVRRATTSNRMIRDPVGPRISPTKTVATITGRDARVGDSRVETIERVKAGKRD